MIKRMAVVRVCMTLALKLMSGSNAGMSYPEQPRWDDGGPRSITLPEGGKQQFGTTNNQERDGSGRAPYHRN